MKSVLFIAYTVVHSNEMDESDLCMAMSRAFRQGEPATALLNLRAYIGGIPYDIMSKEEWESKKSREWFYKMLFYIIFNTMNSLVDTECIGILGRSDVVVQTSKDVFVIELKVDDTVPRLCGTSQLLSDCLR